tara:strand:- start:502 stop:1347 length:846 start_codon:yes stop_codon:yes gene_type:complete
MAYIGTSPSNGVRRKHTYTATAGQTSFSGNDDNGVSLVYVDTEYLDVYQNGVKLVAVSDYASTTGTSVVLVQGASVDDTVEIIVFDVFSVADTVSAGSGGSFGGNIGIGGTLAVTGAVTLSTKLATTNLATGAVVQVVNVQTNTVATTTSTIAFDDTIPQNNEGGEFMTLAITPTSATNKLKIDVVIQLNASATNRIYVVGLFQDSTASAIQVASQAQSLTGSPVNISLQHMMTAGTTSATTFKVRAGPDGASTLTFNGQAGNRKFGGLIASSITITEIAV